MAYQWGATVSASGASAQLGFDITYFYGGNDVIVTVKEAIRCTAGWVGDDFNTVRMWGSHVANRSNVPINFSAGQQIELQAVAKTYTRKYGVATTGSVYGDIQGFELGTPSASRAWSVDPLPYLAPQSVTGLTVVRQSDSRANLSWTPRFTGLDGARPVTQQVVQRRSAATPGWVDVAPLAYNASSWADTGLTTNQWYEYRVRTVGPGGSTYSGVSARIWTTPAAPTGVSAAKQGDDIVVRWSSSAPERSSRTVHVIGEGATVIATVPWDQLSYTVPAPNPLLPHTYWVATRTAGLESGRVNANTIQLAAAPLKPTNLQPSTYAALGENVALTWRFNTGDNSGQSAFQIRWRKGTSGEWTTMAQVSSSQSAATLLSSAVGAVPTVVQWQVRTWAQDPAKDGPWSDTVQFQVVARPTVQITAPPFDGTDIAANRFTMTAVASGTSGTVLWEVTCREINDGKVVWSDTVQIRSGPVLTWDSPARFADGSRVELTVRVSYLLWSLPANRWVMVKYEAPSPPLVDGEWVPENGSVALQVTNPPVPSSGFTMVNLFPNPRFRRTSGEMVMRRNAATNGRLENGLAGTGTITGNGSATMLEIVEDKVGPYGIQRVLQGTMTAKSAGTGWINGIRLCHGTGYWAAITGPQVRVSMWVKVSEGAGPVGLRGYFREGATAYGSWQQDRIQLPADTWTELSYMVSVPDGVTATSVGLAGVMLDVSVQLWCTLAMVGDGPYFDAGWDPDPDPDYVYSRDQSGGSVAAVKLVDGVTGRNCLVVQSKRFAREGEFSARLIPTSSSRDSSMAFEIPTAGRGFGGATATINLVARQPGPVDAAGRARRLMAVLPDQITPAIPNEAGSYPQTLEWEGLQSPFQLRFYNGAEQGGGDVYWTRPLVVGGMDSVEVKDQLAHGWFAGDSPVQAFDGYRVSYQWLGEPDNSVSIATYQPRPEPVYNIVSRWDPETETWIELADDVEVDGSFIDPLPPLLPRVCYQVQAVSALPSVSAPTEECVETVVGHDCSPVLFVNWGPAWQECAGLTFDVDATEKPELLFENEVVLAGDEKPTWVGGSENQTVWSVKGALRSMFADACQVEEKSGRDLFRWRAAAKSTEMQVLRLLGGTVAYGHVAGVSLTTDMETHVPSVSFTFRELEE